MPDTTPKLTRSEQSRLNGAQSKGPITPEGKATSSQNALKHGFAASVNVLISIEDEDDLQRHLAGIRSSFLPQNYMEETLVDQLASLSWRRARLAALEPALLDAQISIQEEKVRTENPGCAEDNYFHLLQAWTALAGPVRQRSEEAEKDPSIPPNGYHIQSLELLRRYQTSLAREFRTTLLDLQLYRKSFAAPPVAAQPNEPEKPAPVEFPKPTPVAPRPQVVAETKPQTAPNPQILAIVHRR